jgi:hypothetical protein
MSMSTLAVSPSWPPAMTVLVNRALEGSPWASKPIVPLRPSKSMS